MTLLLATYAALADVIFLSFKCTNGQNPLVTLVGQQLIQTKGNCFENRIVLIRLW